MPERLREVSSLVVKEVEENRSRANMLKIQKGREPWYSSLDKINLNVLELRDDHCY